MEYCKYHPLTPASFRCEHCRTHQCDQCVNEEVNTESSRCFICDNEVTNLGAKYTANVFWRRLQESFQYPLNKSTILFIIGMAFLTTIAIFLPFTIVWQLILAGIFMKYCFTCLEKSSRGSFTAPNVSSAYDGGIILALKLIAMVVIVTIIVIGIQIWLGLGAATLAGIIIVCCIPAILINFAFTESILESINPAKVASIIAAVGLPYGLLLGLIIIMTGSVGIISEIIGYDSAVLSRTLQSIVSNYYTIVTFHIMGYMIFQYQDEFGFIAEKEESQTAPARSTSDKQLAKIEIMVKEGHYKKAINLFHEALKQEPNDKRIYNQYFTFLLAIKDHRHIENYASFYFKFLKDTHREDLINLSYKKILQAHPKFVPDNAEDRLMLAKECQQSGDSRSAVTLLRGVKQSHPNFKKIHMVYALMADALRNIPNMDKEADQYLALSQRLVARKQAPTMAKKLGKRIPPKKDEAKALKPPKKESTNQQSTTNDNTDQSGTIDYDGGIDFN